jgi:hypothetical protein
MQDQQRCHRRTQLRADLQKSKRALKGREADEVYATLASAGVVAEGAAGSMIENVTKLNCTLDPAVIKDNSGGEADCSFGAVP